MCQMLEHGIQSTPAYAMSSSNALVLVQNQVQFSCSYVLMVKGQCISHLAIAHCWKPAKHVKDRLKSQRHAVNLLAYVQGRACNMTKPAQVASLADYAHAELGSIDLW